MKKLMLIILLCLTLTGCFKIGNENIQSSDEPEEKTPVNTEWPEGDIISYTKGEIIKNTYSATQDCYDIEIINTTYEDYLQYIEALKVMNYSFYDSTGNSTEYYKLIESSMTASWLATNGTKYVIVRYYDSSSKSYENANVVIKLYNSKPNGWQ